MKHRRMYYNVFIDRIGPNGNYWIQGNRVITWKELNPRRNFSSAKHFRTFRKAVKWFNNLPAGITAELYQYDKKTHRSRYWERG